jgi:hypothetical protein
VAGPAYPQPAVQARAYLDRAGPPGEPALMDQHRLPGGTDAVVQQVTSSWAGHAAGRDILHPARVVPGESTIEESAYRAKCAYSPRLHASLARSDHRRSACTGILRHRG